MPLHRFIPCAMAGVLLAGLGAQPAWADVKDGVDAWSRGDYAAAVAEWTGPAEAGDPDALFNLAQAYRLGRGVPEDAARAEALYAQAAGKGHLRAADTYGLMLFQDGRREAALPYVQDAARRGDPRSEYLLGIAHFNGDLVERDWVRAYALLTLANSQGLPQAAPALARMDEFIPMAQRQEGAALAVTMQNEAQAARERELAAADLGVARAPAALAEEAAPQQVTVPRPAATAGVSPSVAAAREAIDQARSATGTESPAQAGASYARPAAPAGRAPEPERVAARSSAPAQAPPARPAASLADGGPWAVQLGAFSVPANAEKLWREVSGRKELAGAQKLLVPAGRVTKLLAAGYATSARAEQACASLKSAGRDCLVTRR
ncbi:sporulation protein [Altererythrobacter sp. B11]|uniref:SPOR domain-containing protein n=1 Tax=Altererythrobacter sp. B11 TaxID=2060312 RepID=UPI000DC70859|nr:SPOR domain-containing protein [Altererythrobacter sp. B11]BBC74237.1 sporulation protein [Altererythrobacter sp. B11]